MALEDLIFHRCWCSIEHAIPKQLDRQAREAKHKIFCPLGHEWVIKESDLDKERRRRELAEQKIAQVADEMAALEKKHKAEIRRMKRRSKAGVCPCCTRTFSNMAEHMAKQHPSYGAKA
jgi:hypothetical protein